MPGQMSSENASSNFIVSYPFASRLTVLPERADLELATARTSTGAPYFFSGKLLKPRIAASLLLLLPKLATTRFHMPPNMVAKIIALADPVVTCGSNIIRMEAFSACGSAYARVNIDSDAIEGEFIGKGTTNVDFQQGLRDALAALNPESQVHLDVGKEELRLSLGQEDFIERKVHLPSRWLRGFAEVAAYQGKMTLIHEVGKLAAARFIQSLPGTNNEKADYYLVSRRQELFLTQQKLNDTVRIGGLARLKLIKALLPYINGLRVYGDKSGNASSWVFMAGPYTLEFVISSAAYRGFSGEGQLLNELASEPLAHILPQVRAALNWQTKIEIEELASKCNTSSKNVRNCLSLLGSNGLVGYDCSMEAYFHRELPFRSSRPLALNPRLKGAKKLIEEHEVEITAVETDFTEACVAGSGVKHIVRLKDNTSTCTCLWYAKHQNDRGPCKHILSVQILLEQQQDGN